MCTVPAYAAVQQEKTQQNLLHGVESFDKSALKHTDTKEKIILPATEGNNKDSSCSHYIFPSSDQFYFVALFI